MVIFLSTEKYFCLLIKNCETAHRESPENFIFLGFYWPRRVEAAALQKQGAAKFLLLTLPAVNFF